MKINKSYFFQVFIFCLILIPTSFFINHFSQARYGAGGRVCEYVFLKHQEKEIPVFVTTLPINYSLKWRTLLNSGYRLFDRGHENTYIFQKCR